MTPDRGERATPRRVAELRERLAVQDDRIDRLEQHVAMLDGRLTVALELVRARIGAELTMLRRVEQRAGQ